MRHEWGLVSLVVAVAGIRPVGAASPLESCYQAATSRTDVGHCLEQRLHAADTAMEKAAMAVHGLAADLSGVTERPEIAAEFEESERAFREYLDRHCAWVGAMAAGGSGSGDMVRDCMIRLTEQHTADLESHLPVGRPAATAGSTGRSQRPPVATPIPAGEWRLTFLQREGERVALAGEPAVTLSFDKNGMAAGRSFVNRYFGTATVSAGGRLSWNGALGSTRMAGPPELMAREDAYLKALGLVTRWRVDGDTMTLDSEDGTILLRFAR